MLTVRPWRLAKQNQQVLASALQTAFNLGMLPELVKTLLGDLTEAVEGRIRRTFDLASLARDAGLKGELAHVASPI